MAKKVFVTGASGFVGSAILRELSRRAFAVTALARRKNPPQIAGDIRQVHGDLSQSAVLDEALRDCDAVIHLVGIILEDPARGVTFQQVHVEGT
ncbi:MAG: NAD-dependent epimerase/dehydratase family protein, partial [Tepidisphaeraceae bacterium]